MRKMQRTSYRWRVRGTRAVVVIVLFAVWEAAARWFVNPMFLSPPSIVLASFGSLFAHPGISYAFSLLLVELGVAFCLSVVVGLMAALIVGSSELSQRSFMPVIFLLYAVPQVTILPVVMLLAGVGPASKIVFGVTHGMFPIIVTVSASLRNIKPVLQQSVISMGASRWQQFRYLVLPHVMPSFFTSMRLSMVATLLGVLLAELYASSRGIGFFASQFTETFDPTDLFGLVIIVALMAIIFNELLRRAELRATAWRRINGSSNR